MDVQRTVAYDPSGGIGLQKERIFILLDDYLRRKHMPFVQGMTFVAACIALRVPEDMHDLAVK